MQPGRDVQDSFPQRPFQLTGEPCLLGKSCGHFTRSSKNSVCLDYQEAERPCFLFTLGTELALALSICVLFLLLLWVFYPAAHLPLTVFSTSWEKEGWYKQVISALTDYWALKCWRQTDSTFGEPLPQVTLSAELPLGVL